MSAYKWKTGSQHKIDADTAGAVCEQLEQTIGLTAQTLVDASRPADAPLHGEFEWDDAIAAESYRQDQARYIIRSLCVVSEQEETQPVRAFFTIAQQPYERVEAIMSVEEKRTALLDLALRELKAFESKYSQLVELAGVFEAAHRLYD